MIIVATEKATGRRYVYCGCAGVDWFAPPPALSRLHLTYGAAARMSELLVQRLVRMFRADNECETVNLAGFDLTIENP